MHGTIYIVFIQSLLVTKIKCMNYIMKCMKQGRKDVYRDIKTPGVPRSTDVVLQVVCINYLLDI